LRNDIQQGPGIITEHFNLTIEDGILIARHFSEEMNLEIAKIYYEKKTKLTAGIVMPLLSDSRRIKIFDKEARAYLSRKNLPDVISASAILVQSNTQELLGNIFIYNYKLKIPAKTFNDEEKALIWLKNFRV
jgi:hypothetical protein